MNPERAGQRAAALPVDHERLLDALLLSVGPRRVLEVLPCPGASSSAALVTLRVRERGSGTIVAAERGKFAWAAQRLVATLFLRDSQRPNAGATKDHEPTTDAGSQKGVR